MRMTIDLKNALFAVIWGDGKNNKKKINWHFLRKNSDSCCKESAYVAFEEMVHCNLGKHEMFFLCCLKHPKKL